MEKKDWIGALCVALSVWFAVFVWSGDWAEALAMGLGGFVGGLAVGPMSRYAARCRESCRRKA